ncbi:hypothetical protein GX586_12075 [bacterium]|nr:hypothetical protein [bacterium]
MNAHTPLSALCAAGLCSSAALALPQPFIDGVFDWQASDPLLAADTNAPGVQIAAKDPTFVFSDGLWHLFCTVRRQDGPVDTQYFCFKDWKDAGKAKGVSLGLHDQYYCAPQVFYYEPHELWYLVYQINDSNAPPGCAFGPAFSTTPTIGAPASWTKPRRMIDRKPDETGWLDFWVICDDTKAYLFFTSLDGRMWRCETGREAFPRGWSKPSLALKADVFEASHTYKLKGADLYLTMIEAQDRAHNRRYFKAYLADRLDGEWRGLADSLEKPFAAFSNVLQAHPWTASISHGEIIRTGVNELMEIDPHDLRIIFQGASDDEYRGGNYGRIPWRLGMLEPTTNQPARNNAMEDPTADLIFTDARDLAINGKAFSDTGRFYSRLPLKAEGVVPPAVWSLAQQPCGITVDFWSDTTVLGADLELECEAEGPPLNTDCSIDCYAHDGTRWGWVGILKNLKRPRTTDVICRGLARTRTRFRIYLPFAERVKSLRIGVEKGASLEPAAPATNKPVCFYGTSIIHGFSARRAGMTLPAMIGRRLDWPVWNLGFSGNARMEPAMAELLAGLDPAVYVLDCLPNMGPDLVDERVAPFVRTLRAAHPATPIVLVENIVYQATYMLEDKRGGWGLKNDALKAVHAQLVEEGVTGLFYVPGGNLLGTDGDGAVDGTHPNELGFYRMADALEPVLRPLLDR